MKYGSPLQNIVRTRSTDTSLAKGIEYAYVTDVAVGSNDPELEGAVKVLLPDSIGSSEWIYPINYHFRFVPTKGELVVVYAKDARGIRYYGPPINIHNYPTHNSVSAQVKDTLDYNEPDYVNPYRLFSGDTLLEGRFGQSIRFSQTLPGKNVWSEGKDQGKSAIIISSGQQSSDDSSILLQEDLNKDAAAIVLLEGGKLKFDGATDYEGNQALVISDRVHLYAREESVELTAKQQVALQDEKWKITLTEIVDLIEILVNGGNITAQGPTGVNGEALAKLIGIKKRITNGI